MSRAVASVLAAAAVVAVSLVASVAPSSAQQWPAKPVTVVQGFLPAPGSTSSPHDPEPLEKALGQPLVFDIQGRRRRHNASAFVAKAAPDGYTLLMGTAGTHGINAALYKKIPFDVEVDFTPPSPRSPTCRTC